MRSALETRLARLARRDSVVSAAAAISRSTAVPVWLVGGAVRDAALGRGIRDVDMACGARRRPAVALVRELEALWGARAFRFRKRGVTTWRFSIAGRTVDVVDVGSRGIERDLFRRELTINAIAYEPLGGRLLDPTGGLRDLRRKVLRLPRPGVVREDPVRALRCARFVAELEGFRVHGATLPEIRSAAPALRLASVERVLAELDRILVSPAPHVGMTAVFRWGLLPSVLPELSPLASCLAGRDRPDIWTHTLLTLERSARRASYPGASIRRNEASLRVLRWSLLLHDVAKPATLEIREDGKPTFHGHEVLGARRAEGVLRHLRADRALVRRVRSIVLFHLRPGHLADAGAPERGLRRLVRDAGADLPVLVAHAACDALGSGASDPSRWRRLRRVLLDLERRHLERESRPLPRLVTGREVMRVLGLPPGPEVGRVLEEVRALQEDGVLASGPDALAYLATLR